VAQLSLGRILGALSCAALLGGLVAALRKLPDHGIVWAQTSEARLKSFGTLQELGAVLYTQWLFPFEAVSLLLLVAIVGAVVVAKSRI
jgi:NADH-quinone oxidoreductase subunit J